MAVKSFGNWGKEDTGHLLKTGVPPAINLSLPKASVKLPSGQQFLSRLKTKESYMKSGHEHRSADTTDIYVALIKNVCFFQSLSTFSLCI